MPTLPGALPTPGGLLSNKALQLTANSAFQLSFGSLLASTSCGFGEVGQRWLVQLKPGPLDDEIMHWESALESAIEVAIAIAGFSGIVAAVGQRATGRWSEADQLRLRILLTASGAALVFGFLPFLIIDWVSPPQIWHLASGLLALYLLGISIHRLRQAFVSGIAAEVGVGPWRLTSQAAMVAMLAANAVWFASASVYVLGVLWSLFIAFMSFVTLLLESWREPPAASPPAV